jgi:hypothetical protein
MPIRSGTSIGRFGSVIAKVFYREDVGPRKLVAAIEEILARKDLYRARFSIFDEDKRNYLGAKTAVDAIEAALADRVARASSRLVAGSEALAR